PKGGAMVSVRAPLEQVSEAIAREGLTVSVAAVNAPDQVVISGVEEDVLRVAERLRADAVESTRLAVSHAFHSALLEPMLADLGKAAEHIRFAPPAIPLISNVTGEL